MSLRASNLVSVLLVILAGCSAVTTRQPLPLTAKPADQEKLEGTWLMSENEPVFLRFASNGVAHLAGLEWEEDEFHLERCQLIFTDGEHGRFLSMRCLEKGTWDEEYQFLRYSIVPGGDLVLWLPRSVAFEEAITTGQLQGEISRGKHSTTIIVTAEPAALLAFVDDPERLDLFEYTEPMVVRKLQGTGDR